MTSLANTIRRGGFTANLAPGRDVTGPEPEAPGLGRLALDAINTEWISSHLHRSLTKHTGSMGMVDPGYNPLDEREWERLADGIDPEYWEELTYARGALHGLQIRDNILSRQASRQRLAEAGMTGAALTLAANVIDPTTLIAGAAVGGVGAVGTKATRLQRFMQYGMSNAIVDAPLETVRAATDPETGAGDVVASVIGSFALGGGLGLGVDRLGRSIQEAALRDLRNAELDEVRLGAQEIVQRRQVGGAMGAASADEFKYDLNTLRDQAIAGRQAMKEAGLSEWWAKYIAPVSTREAQRERIAGALEHLGADDATKADVMEVFDEGGSVQDVLDRIYTPQYEPPVVGRAADETPEELAARTGGDGDDGIVRPNKLAGDFDLWGKGSTEKAALTGFRRSTSALFGKSKSAAVRLMSSILVEDALLKVDGKGSGTMAASTWTHVTVKRMGAKFYPAHDAAWRSVAKSGVFKSKEQFNEHVSARIVQSDFSTEILDSDTVADVAVKQSVKAARDGFAAQGALASRHGVEGFEEFEPNAFYLPRNYDTQKVQRLVAENGEEGVAEYIGDVYRAGRDDIDDEQALKIGKTILRTVQGLNKIDSAAANRIFSPDNADILRDVLDKSGALTQEQADDIVVQLVQKGRGRNPHSLSRFGSQASEEYVGTIRRPDGTRSEPVRFRTDFFDSDIESIYQRYTHSMVGTSAMQEVYARTSQQLGLEGDRAIKTRAQWIKALVDDARANGDDSASYIESLTKNLDFVDKLIRGQPIEDDGFASTLLRRMRAVSYAMFGGGFGLAQVSEAGIAAGRIGAKAMLTSLPAAREIFRRGADGKLTASEYAWTEYLGAGLDRMLNRTSNRFDAANEIMAEHDVGGLFDQTLRRMNRVIADVSGLAPINIFLQRFSAQMATQRVLDLSLDGRVVTETGDIRIGPKLRKIMEGLGLDEERAKRVIRAMRDEATRDGGAVRTVDGALGRRFKALNPDDFQDQEALADLMQAITLWSRSAILEADLGQLNAVMGGKWGKTFLQFQSFHIAAYEKILLAGLQRAHWDEFAGWSVSAFIGAMVFTGQMHATAAFRDDRKSFLKNRLGVESLDDQFGTVDGLLNTVAVGIQRGGFSSILPQGIDSMLAIGGYGPMFNARNSGLNGILFDPRNAPAGAVVDNAARAVGGAMSVLPGDDRQFSTQDARAIAKTLPLARIPVFQQAVEMAIGLAPEDEN